MTLGSAQRKISSPPAASGRPLSPRPIDLVHLSRQAGCDTRLEREVLTLLVKQLGAAAPRIAELSFDETRTLLHTLEGTALNVGAFPLAAAIARYRDAEGGEDERDEVLGEIERVVRFASAVVA